MRGLTVRAAFVALVLFVAGCTSNQVGPIRPITIAEDVAYARPLAEPDLSAFYGAKPETQASVRNQIVTARMYIADVQYHYYEARLTREMQEEGLGATLATLGLTTASTLVGSAGTKTVLSGVATAVVGADKAYNEKQLLSNTIQALQAQMRADRKAQAAVIYAKMFKEGGNNTKTITPIFEYTLPMALSDADNYYQAGTIASALIGLSKTLANAERNADQAKSQAGPNPLAVADAKATAAPVTTEPAVPQIGAGVEPTVVGSRPPPMSGGGGKRDDGKPANENSADISKTQLTNFEVSLTKADVEQLQRAVCVKPTGDDNLGELGSETRLAIQKALKSTSQLVTDKKGALLRKRLKDGATCPLS
jgi:hypothetical protein